ncbi:hypothetical protein E4U41_007244 [Claviceps citrina]|nr:hypothetical protein E4U41_007244 [Claviceps citrina]
MAPPPPPPHPDALQTLDALVQTASALLTQLQSVLSEIHSNPAAAAAASSPPSPDHDATPLNALSLAHDSASLIRAHGTKISLLIINEPFTPSAISTVLRELIAGPIPALASSAQACTPERYTGLVCRELASRAGRVLSELGALVRKIPANGEVVPRGDRGGFAAGGDRGSLPATGLLWAACDEVIGLAGLGVGGVIAARVDQWRDTLGDIMEELKEWGDEEPEDDDDDDDDDEDDEDDDDHDQDQDQDGQEQDNQDDVTHLADHLHTTTLSPQALLDQIMNSHHQIPKSDPHRIRPRLETSLQRLRLVTLLYQALIKRRLNKLPPFPFPIPSPPAAADSSSGIPIPSRLDEMAKLLAALPDRFGDLACAFYELEPAEIDRLMDQCFSDACAAGELVVRDWNGGLDAFSDWVARFQGEVSKAW